MNDDIDDVDIMTEADEIERARARENENNIGNDRFYRTAVNVLHKHNTHIPNRDNLYFFLSLVHSLSQLVL